MCARALGEVCFIVLFERGSNFPSFRITIHSQSKPAAVCSTVPTSRLLHETNTIISPQPSTTISSEASIPHPMIALMGEFVVKSAVEAEAESNFGKTMQRRRQPAQSQPQSSRENTNLSKPPSSQNSNYNIKRVSDSIFSAAIHPFNTHLRCHVTRYTKDEEIAFTCDAFTCYQFVNLQEFQCPHAAAIETDPASSLNLSPTSTFPAELFNQNATALEEFRKITGISDESLERCQRLISVAKGRDSPAIVQVTSLCFSVIAEHVQCWCREGRVFVRQWGPKWTCFCGSSTRCEHKFCL